MTEPVANYGETRVLSVAPDTSSPVTSFPRSPKGSTSGITISSEPFGRSKTSHWKPVNSGACSGNNHSETQGMFVMKPTLKSKISFGDSIEPIEIETLLNGNMVPAT